MEPNRKSKRSLLSVKKKQARYYDVINDNFEELYCKCDSNDKIDCSLLTPPYQPKNYLSPKYTVQNQEGDFCHCRPFISGEIKCQSDDFCPPPVLNCVEEYQPALITLSRAPDNVLKSPCKLCRKIGCIDSKNPENKYIAGEKRRDNCTECRCPKSGGKLKCKNICKISAYLGDYKKPDYSYLNNLMMDQPDKVAAKNKMGNTSKTSSRASKRGRKSKSKNINPLSSPNGNNPFTKLINEYEFKTKSVNNLDFQAIYQHNQPKFTGVQKTSSEIHDCCLEGKNFAKMTKSCQQVNNSSSATIKITKSHTNLCNLTRKSCCESELSIKYCNLGMVTAVSLRPCNVGQPIFYDDTGKILPTNFFDIKYREIMENCCDCCWSGILMHNEVKDEGNLASLENICELVSNTYSNHCKTSFSQCCNSGQAGHLTYNLDDTFKDLVLIHLKLIFHKTGLCFREIPI